jgi:beta-N-acetylhexosaminidase
MHHPHLSDVGHHFIVGLSGTRLSDLDKKILSELKPAGILFLKRNFEFNLPYTEWLQSFWELLSSIKEYAERDRMFFSLDHEGGRVHRTPPPITHFPEPITFREQSFDIARTMAQELRSIGINVSWSPSVDIHTNPANPVIGHRAFGTTADEVITFTSAFMRGLLEHGIMACIKHFPGHGDTHLDSHIALPTVDKSLDELRSTELKPFAALINQGAPMVMTSHIMFPKIDPTNPATLSKIWLQDILRKELGFGGVIVTDDLDMKAISERQQDADLSVHALDAGCELFIVARYPDGSSDKPLTMAQGLCAGIANSNERAIRSNQAKEKIEYLLQYAVGHYTPHELKN